MTIAKYRDSIKDIADTKAKDDRFLSIVSGTAKSIQTKKTTRIG
jgi:hypothetical protein